MKVYRKKRFSGKLIANPQKVGAYDFIKLCRGLLTFCLWDFSTSVQSGYGLDFPTENFCSKYLYYISSSVVNILLCHLLKYLLEIPNLPANLFYIFALKKYRFVCSTCFGLNPEIILCISKERILPGNLERDLLVCGTYSTVTLT